MSYILTEYDALTCMNRCRPKGRNKNNCWNVDRTFCKTPETAFLSLPLYSHYILLLSLNCGWELRRLWIWGTVNHLFGFNFQAGNLTVLCFLLQVSIDVPIWASSKSCVSSTKKIFSPEDVLNPGMWQNEPEGGYTKVDLWNKFTSDLKSKSPSAFLHGGWLSLFSKLHKLTTENP